MIRCDCCRRVSPPGGLGEYDGDYVLCDACAGSWERSAAAAIAVRERVKDFEPYIRQFVLGKSCWHHVGKQRPDKTLEQMP